MTPTLPRSEIAVQAEGLTRSYGPPEARVEALRGVSLGVGRGERLALLGRSGSGKSTLLNLLGGLDRPTSGKIVVSGQELAGMSNDALASYRLRSVGMIFQSYHLVPWRTALENVELPLIFAGHSPRKRRDVARRALDDVGLSPRAGHRPGELSGGERQRVAIARALVNQPRLLLADEPTGNLDTATAAAVIDGLLERLDDRETTLIVVTHDDELARRLADRVMRMQDGQFVS